MFKFKYGLKMSRLLICWLVFLPYKQSKLIFGSVNGQAGKMSRVTAVIYGKDTTSFTG